MIDWRKGLEEAYGLLIEAQADPDLAAPEWVERCDQWMDTYPPSKARAPDAVPCPKCADRMNLALRLRAIAADIAAAGINGFGNQVSDVADALERTDQPAACVIHGPTRFVCAKCGTDVTPNDDAKSYSTTDQQAACTRIDAGLVQPNSGTDIPTDKS
jgi:hypothetical protein